MKTGAIGAGVAIPDAALGRPDGVLDRVQHKRVDVVRHELFGLRVVLGGVDAGLLRGCDASKREEGCEGGKGRLQGVLRG